MWRKRIGEILSEHNDKRNDGRIASERTKTHTGDVVFASFRQLHELGFKIQEPENLRHKHIEALVHHWSYTQQKQVTTIQVELSRLRRFCRMIGKKNLVKSLPEYLPDVPKDELKVRSATRQGKSPAALGIPIEDILQRVRQKDHRLYLMFLMEMVLGLRREEAIKAQPHQQDRGHVFYIPPGHAKNGRSRSILLDEYQRHVLDYVKSKTGKNEALGWRYSKSGEIASLRQNEDRYKNMLYGLGITKKSLGITPHALRAQFSEVAQCKLGILPASMGGTREQSKNEEYKIRLGHVSQDMGHNRTSVITAYSGELKPAEQIEANVRMKITIEEALPLLSNERPVLSDEMMQDCLQLVSHMSELGIHLTVPQAFHLWKKWNSYSFVDWSKPGPNAEIMMQMAAKSLLIQAGRKE